MSDLTYGTVPFEGIAVSSRVCFRVRSRVPARLRARLTGRPGAWLGVRVRLQARA